MGGTFVPRGAKKSTLLQNKVKMQRYRFIVTTKEMRFEYSVVANSEIEAYSKIKEKISGIICIEPFW